AETPEERKALIDEMQEIFYNEAPYHVLFYDATLSAYRTDRFTGWVNQPDNGTPLFGYGPHGYTALQLVSETGESPSPGASPTTPADGASPAPGDGASPAPGTGGPDGQPTGGVMDNPALLAAILGLVAVALVALLLVRRRRRTTVEEE
ncbi:MAG TPA: LPXTG cell wall anchor domain-containing protein, partial [Vitreimonas sp.]|nr:LPXTG cell wall anchor domain-containing protein [Vitreimonas sp.]